MRQKVLGWNRHGADVRPSSDKLWITADRFIFQPFPCGGAPWRPLVRRVENAYAPAGMILFTGGRMNFFRMLLLAAVISGLFTATGCQVKTSGQMDVGMGVYR